MTKPLTEQKCVACEGGMPPLREAEVEILRKQVDNWRNINNKKIAKDFTWSDFTEALNFVNQVGEIAEAENHHPDICLYDYKKVTITTTTHAIGGLSNNDFIIAAKIDQIKI